MRAWPSNGACAAAIDTMSSRTPASRRRPPIPARWAPYVFISPFFILFGVFGLFPLAFSFVMSLNQWDPVAGAFGMHWLGLENYVYAITRDDWLRKALFNTLWIALVSGIPQHLVALPLAWFLHRGFGRARNAVVGAYFLPFITSSVAISLVFASLFSKDFGLVNAAFASLREVPVLGWLMPGQAIDWAQPGYTKWMISAVVFWRYVGWNTVLYLSAIQTIPQDLLEAAAIDGANSRQRFLHIVVPMLKPMVFFAVTLSIIGNLQLFEEPFILTGGTGGIDQAGKTAAMHMYAVAFIDGDFGTASAIAWLLFVLIAGATALNKRLLGGRE
jgi:multiple sugar transport system permease protein